MKKDGFTLIEIVFSIAIISIVTLGIVYMVGGNMRALKAGYDYDQSVYDIQTEIETSGISGAGETVPTIDMSVGSVPLKRYIVKNDATGAQINYYKYK